jgi:hypothetical protein
MNWHDALRRIIGLDLSFGHVPEIFERVSFVTESPNFGHETATKDMVFDKCLSKKIEIWFLR